MIFALKPFTKDCSLTRLITRGYFALNISNTLWLKTIAIWKYKFMDDFLPTIQLVMFQFAMLNNQRMSVSAGVLFVCGAMKVECPRGKATRDLKPTREI
jgi:hypothetical protein